MNCECQAAMVKCIAENLSDAPCRNRPGVLTLREHALASCQASCPEYGCGGVSKLLSVVDCAPTLQQRGVEATCVVNSACVNDGDACIRDGVAGSCSTHCQTRSYRPDQPSTRVDCPTSMEDFTKLLGEMCRNGDGPGGDPETCVKLVTDDFNVCRCNFCTIFLKFTSLFFP